MGQSGRLSIDLRTLQEVGDAAVRATRWMEEHGLASSNADAPRVELLSVGAEGKPAAPLGFEHARSERAPDGKRTVVFGHRSEAWRAAAGVWWCLVVRGPSEDPIVAVRVEIPARAGFVLPAEVRLGKVPSGEASDRPSRGRVRDPRAEPLPVLVVDPTWRDESLRQSTMAQLAEWWMRSGGRVPGRPEERVDLPQEALDWWSDWAHRGDKRDPAARLSSAYDVVARSRTPTTAAGHRKYWSTSLRHWRAEEAADVRTIEVDPRTGVIRPSRGSPGARYPAELNQAIEILQIGRSTAYARLARGGTTLRELLQGPNPLAALVGFLSAQAPRRMPDRSRIMVESLRAAGMKDNSARRLERRIRTLPPEEQHRRVRAALDRIPAKRRQVGRRPIPYPLDPIFEDDD